MPHPAGQRVGEHMLVPLGHIKKGRCARTTVQIFIAAPNRQIGIGRPQVNRDGSHTVAQIPKCQRPLGLCRRRQGRHVVHRS